jgi:hypothetical protein
MESCKLRACAGPCDEYPITPICFTPLKASLSFGKRCRPPLTTFSSTPFSTRGSRSKTLEVIGGTLKALPGTRV